MLLFSDEVGGSPDSASDLIGVWKQRCLFQDNFFFET
jgi:hypothetical protein